MALRSRLGGEARLQQAICLDSLGRNSEAYEIYKRIENHPAPGVAKKAKRWVLGVRKSPQARAAAAAAVGSRPARLPPAGPAGEHGGKRRERGEQRAARALPAGCCLAGRRRTS